MARPPRRLVLVSAAVAVAVLLSATKLTSQDTWRPTSDTALAQQAATPTPKPVPTVVPSAAPSAAPTPTPKPSGPPPASPSPAPSPTATPLPSGTPSPSGSPSPSPSPSASPEPTPVPLPSAGPLTPAKQVPVNPADPACTLLERPAGSPPLSGAAENALVMRCYGGPRAPQAAPPQSRAPSIATVNNPIADTYPNTTQSETTIAILKENVIAAWNDSGQMLETASLSGYARSTTFGATWTDRGIVPPTTMGDTCWGPRNIGDPVLAAGVPGTGRFYFGSLARYFITSAACGAITTTESCIGVNAFQVQSDTWSAPVLLGCSTGGDSFQDKEWIAVDRRTSGTGAGNVYVCWTRFIGNASQILFARSTNSGVSYSAPLAISAAGLPVQGCQVAVGPNGEVYVAWEQYSGTNSQRIRRSMDNGVSFLPETLVANVAFVSTTERAGACSGRSVLPGHVRITEFAALAVHPTTGHLYLTWNDGARGYGNADVVFTRSTDLGATWSAPIRVNNDTTATDQFMPAIGVAANGALLITWYDRRHDPANLRMDIYAARSLDNGLSWSNVRVTDQSFDVPPIWPGNFDNRISGCYMGDYNHVTSDATSFYLIWSDNRNRIVDGFLGQHADPDVFSSTIPVTGAIP